MMDKYKTGFEKVQKRKRIDLGSASKIKDFDDWKKGIDKAFRESIYRLRIFEDEKIEKYLEKIKKDPDLFFSKSRIILVAGLLNYLSEREINEISEKVCVNRSSIKEMTDLIKQKDNEGFFHKK